MKRILAVDNDKEVRDKYQRVLEGYDLTVFDDPAKALVDYRDNDTDYDLVITGYHFPGAPMTGLVVAMDVISIHRSYNKKEPKIIMCSSSPSHRLELTLLNWDPTIKDVEFIRKDRDDKYLERLAKRVNELLREE
jgi:CheY-like chemotaxis protein